MLTLSCLNLERILNYTRNLLKIYILSYKGTFLDFCHLKVVCRRKCGKTNLSPSLDLVRRFLDFVDRAGPGVFQNS